jgi:hypothetical protein
VRVSCPFGQVSSLRCATPFTGDTPRDRASDFRLPASEAFACGPRARATALVRLQRIAIEHARLFRLRLSRPARAFEPSSKGSAPRSARSIRLAPPSPTIPLHGAALAFPTFPSAFANSYEQLSRTALTIRRPTARARAPLRSREETTLVARLLLRLHSAFAARCFRRLTVREMHRFHGSSRCEVTLSRFLR